MQIQFLGAAETVTGSKFFLRSQARQVLLDCGMFQGQRPLRERNWQRLPLVARDLDAVVLTHAHIDHTGYLPRLDADGLKASIHCTWGTRDLCEILLPDAARLQEEEANFRNRKKRSKHSPALPLYSIVDAEHVLKRLVGHRYNEAFEPVPGWTLSYRDAGHILGSAWIDANIEGRRWVFSGDLGRVNSPILRDPTPPSGSCDVLLLESTYGNRLHPASDKKQDLGELIIQIARRGGTIVIPAFAVERSQEILYLLEELIRDKDIPKLPVYIDSPMAVKATRLFQEYKEYYDEEATELVARGGKVFSYSGLALCETVQQSQAIARNPEPKIVISASGMATGGRVLHHLRNYLPHPKNHVLLVGFQSPGTRGWHLAQGDHEIKIFGERVPVKASVSKLEGFSGHADAQGLMDWCHGFETPPKVTFLVHGEPAALTAQADALSDLGWNVIVPAHHQEFDVGALLSGT
jgi:metallo-beta-lactamase family protein